MTGTAVVWIGAIGFGLVVELVTTQLVAGYVAVGGVAALIADLAGANEGVQVGVFAVVAVGLLAITRHPLKAMLYKSAPLRAMNVSALAGATALVTESYPKLRATGQARIGGEVWTAKSADGETLVVGEEMVVDRIEGVTAILRR